MIDAFLEGKATVANTVIPTTFWTAAPESELNQYEFNPEKAKELLAAAGYVDKDGDGFVEDPKDNHLKFHLDTMQVQQHLKDVHKQLYNLGMILV